MCLIMKFNGGKNYMTFSETSIFFILCSEECGQPADLRYVLKTSRILQPLIFIQCSEECGQPADLRYVLKTSSILQSWAVALWQIECDMDHPHYHIVYMELWSLWMYGYGIPIE